MQMPVPGIGGWLKLHARHEADRMSTVQRRSAIAHRAIPTLVVDSFLRSRQAGTRRIETKKKFVGMKTPAYLNALPAFEASARHGSFSGAASELGVTAAAVGQLVRGLEEWIGSPLFHRSGSGTSRLAPTEVAARGLPDIRAGLDCLSLSLERLREATASGVLTVAVSPAFAAKWMLPRLDRFQAQWPDMDVRLDTGLKLMDYATQGIDIGVRYGGGRWAVPAAHNRHY